MITCIVNTFAFEQKKKENKKKNGMNMKERGSLLEIK